MQDVYHFELCFCICVLSPLLFSMLEKFAISGISVIRGSSLLNIRSRFAGEERGLKERG